MMSTVLIIIFFVVWQKNIIIKRRHNKNKNKNEKMKKKNLHLLLMRWHRIVHASGDLKNVDDGLYCNFYAILFFFDFLLPFSCRPLEWKLHVEIKLMKIPKENFWSFKSSKKHCKFICVVLKETSFFHFIFNIFFSCLSLTLLPSDDDDADVTGKRKQ